VEGGRGREWRVGGVGREGGGGGEQRVGMGESLGLSLRFCSPKFHNIS